MALSDTDKEWIELTVEKNCYKASKDILAEHIKSCPHGKMILVAKAAAFGMAIGIGIVIGDKGIALAKFIIGCIGG